VPVMISRTTAAMLFGRTNPLGKEIMTNYRSRARLEVIGLVGDVRQTGLTTEPGCQIHLPLPYGASQYVVARILSQSHDFAADIRSTVRAMDRSAAAGNRDRG
ncbi:MAG TPA: hypothetical protein PLK67_13110, partial [Bryobacteraceae bacterium]|nr:hypothetical protein [Bryobacteraceae bacterium]